MGLLVLFVFLLLWAIFIWLCVLVLRDVARFLRRLPEHFRAMSRYRELERGLRQDRDRIVDLSVSEAQIRLEPFLACMAPQLTHWDEPPRPEVRETLGRLDPHLSQLLERHRRIYVVLRDDESGGVTLSAELATDAAELSSSEVPDGFLPIGISDHGEFVLGVRVGSGVIHRIRNGKVTEQHPSVFHFILASLVAERVHSTTADEV